MNQNSGKRGPVRLFLPEQRLVVKIVEVENFSLSRCSTALVHKRYLSKANFSHYEPLFLIL